MWKISLGPKVHPEKCRMPTRRKWLWEAQAGFHESYWKVDNFSKVATSIQSEKAEHRYCKGDEFADRTS